MHIVVLGTSHPRSFKSSTARTLLTANHAFFFSWISGFNFSFITDLTIPGISTTACFKEISGEPTPSAEPSHNGWQVHNAWDISWGPSDVATLSPPPPQLPCTTSVLDVWVPGGAVTPKLPADVCNDDLSHASESEIAGMRFMMIGLPIIGILSVASCGAMWCHRRRKARRAFLGPPLRGEIPAPGHT